MDSKPPAWLTLAQIWLSVLAVIVGLLGLVLWMSIFVPPVVQ
jgi:hypothetical protein